MYGILLDVIYKTIISLERHEDIIDKIWTITRMLVRNVERHWHEPDRRIWEIRNESEHFVFSKVLCWVAVDRGIKIAKHLVQNDYISEWESLRDTIHKDVMEKGWNNEVGAFTQFYGSENLDAANLLMETYGFIDATHEKFISTVEKTQENLCEGALMYRYKNNDDFGKPESAFTVCSFWMVEALYRTGKKDDAIKMFEELLSYSNHLDLFSEDIDFKSKRLLGNFPQAYSHLALISAAFTLDRNDSIECVEKILGNQLLR